MYYYYFFGRAGGGGSFVLLLIDKLSTVSHEHGVVYSIRPVMY